MPLRRFVSKVTQVLHPDSPGSRVYVRRGWFRRLFFDPQGAHISEHFLKPEEMEDVQTNAEELARIFHGLYERNAPRYGYSTRPRTRVFIPQSPHGQLLIRAMFDLITGGFRLSDPVEIGKPVGPLIAGLKLPHIDIVVGENGGAQHARVGMSVVEGGQEFLFTLFFNDGQSINIHVDDNPYELSPAEKNRIGSELVDFVNAQLYARQEALRVVALEYGWSELGETGMINHTSKLNFGPSVWETTLADPDYTPITSVTRPEPVPTPA